MKSWLRVHGFSLFLALACVGLSAQVVLLARENRALKEAQAAAPASAPSSDGARFTVGEPFAPFAARHANGTVEDVRFDGEHPRTLLFVLADACPVCPQIVPRWQEVAPFFLDASTRVMGVLLDRPAAEDDPWIDGVPLTSFADLSSLPLEKLRTVPLTVLIDDRGTIEWLHYGTLTEARLEELMLRL